MTAAMPISELPNLDPEAELARLLLGKEPQDAIDFVETYFTIDNENGKIVEVHLYPQQKLMYQKATGRDITVKGRQTRASSALLMARIRRLVFQLTGARCIIGAQDDATTALFRTKIQHFIADLVRGGFEIKLLTDNDKEMVFSETENRIQFVSGEQRIMGRAFAAQEVHLSELAHWKESTAASLLGGLLPSVPAAPRGRIDFESTPAGEQGAFYKYAMAAKPYGKNPDDEWTLQFYEWWLEPRYAVTDDPSDELRKLLSPERYQALREEFVPSDEEEKLQKKGLRLDQLVWRRLMKAEQDKTTAPFAQEYPEDVFKCWLGVSGLFFDTIDGVDHVGEYRADIVTPVKYLDKLPYKGNEVSFYGPNLCLWEMPIPECTYVVTFDAAGGGQDEESDYTSVGIWNATKEKRVGRLTIKCTPAQAGLMAAAIGTFYGTALIGGERSHHGDSVFDKLKELGYENIYYHVDPDHPLPKNKMPKPGIYPDPIHREKILNSFREAVIVHAFQSYDAMLVQQMSMFTWEKARNGMKAAAERKAGSHDDVLMEAANGWYLLSVARQRSMSMKIRQRLNQVPEYEVTKGGIAIVRQTPEIATHRWLR